MSRFKGLKENPEMILWQELEQVTAVMLGADGGGIHMQPMAPQVAPEEKTIYFFTHKTTDLAKGIKDGSNGQICLVNNDDHFYACLNGHLAPHHSRDTIDRFWSSVVSAWFEKGKDDPELTMLAFKPREASIWASTDSSVAFGWAIAKANLTGDKPDIGDHVVIQIGGGKVG